MFWLAPELAWLILPPLPFVALTPSVARGA